MTGILISEKIIPPCRRRGAKKGTYGGRPDSADSGVHHHRPYLGQVSNGVLELLRRRLENGCLRGRYELFHDPRSLLWPLFSPFSLEPCAGVQLSSRYAQKSEGCSRSHIAEAELCGVVCCVLGSIRAHAQLNSTAAGREVGIFWNKWATSAQI